MRRNAAARIGSFVVLAIVVLILAAPPAGAQSLGSTSDGSTSEYVPWVTDFGRAPAGNEVRSVTLRPVRVADGFDWAAASMGATVAALTIIVALGLALAVARARATDRRARVGTMPAA